MTTSKADGVTPILCLLDFGLIAHVSESERSNMTRAILNLLQGDYDTLISRDAKELGFLPHELDVTELKPVLKKILKEGLVDAGSSMHDRKRNLMAISNELNDVFFRYPFRCVTDCCFREILWARQSDLLYRQLHIIIFTQCAAVLCIGYQRAGSAGRDCTCW